MILLLLLLYLAESLMETEVESPEDRMGGGWHPTSTERHNSQEMNQVSLRNSGDGDILWWLAADWPLADCQESNFVVGDNLELGGM